MCIERQDRGRAFRGFILALSFWGVFGLRAQEGLAQTGIGDRSAPARRAVDVPHGLLQDLAGSPSKALPRLVAYLTANSSDPIERVRVIHDWIALNIVYDVPMYLSGRIAAQSYQDVLRRKKAVCEGYAGLLKEMCRWAGIECRMIPGHARGAGYSVFDPENTNDENHAWNAVRIDDRWWLIDVTWDAGHVEGDRFIRKYSSQYLFAEPTTFVYSHFPADARWQNLDRAITAEQFLTLPDLQGEYFLWCNPPPDDWTRIIRSDGRTDLAVPVRSHALFNAEVVEVFRTEVTERKIRITEVKQPGAAFVQSGEEGKDRIALAFPHPGKYVVRLFAKRKGDLGEYRSVGFLGVECGGGSAMQFPEQFSGFRENGYQLLSPFDEMVHAATRERFAFFLPGIVKAMLTCDSRQVDLDHPEPGRFEGEIEVGQASDVVLWGAQNEKSTRYAAILRFPVAAGK